MTNEPEFPAHPPLPPYEVAAPPGYWGGQPAWPPMVPIPPPPRVWTVLLVFAVSQAAHLIGAVGVLLGLALVMHGDEIDGPHDFGAVVGRVATEPSGILLTLLCAQLLFAAIALGAAACSPTRLVDRLRLRAPAIGLGTMLLAIVGVAALNLVFVAMGGLGWLPESKLLEELGQSIQSFRGWVLVAAVLVIAIGPGVGEELLFRGYIQTRFSQRWGAFWGCFWTSLLFGLMHLDLSQGIFAAAIGLYLGYLAERTHSIRPSMLCHAMNNALATLTTAWGFVLVGFHENFWALLGGLAVLTSCLVVLHLATRRRQSGPASETAPA